MALRRGDSILVDTNVIIEAHRVGCWPAVTSQFKLITVEKAIEETQTGRQNRSPEQNIHEAELRTGFHQISAVTRTQLATIDLDYLDHGLDDGEHHLVALAASLNDASWLLNSPDKGTIRFCSRARWLDRLIALETMTDMLGLPHGRRLRGNHTASWLRHQVNQFRFGLG